MSCLLRRSEVTLLHLQMDQKASAVMLQVNASPSYKVKQSTPCSKAGPVVSLGAQAITDYSRIQIGYPNSL